MNRCVFPFLVIAVCTGAALAAGPSTQPILKSWRGTVSRDALRSLVPRTKFIDSELEFKKIWRRWNRSSGAPAVDFAKHIVIVATVPGPNELRLTLPRDEQGDLRLEATSTRRGGPGFSYMMAMISRANVESIEGVSLDTGDDQIQITVVGVLRNNDVTLGSETSGTVITSKRISFGVEFDGNVAFEKSAIRYDGRRVFVSGELEEKSGTAPGERWIIHATRIRLFGEAGSG